MNLYMTQSYKGEKNLCLCILGLLAGLCNSDQRKIGKRKTNAFINRCIAHCRHGSIQR